MNIGTFDAEHFTKMVNFSKAVLWHTRELSLPISTIERIQQEKIPLMIFRDEGKKEQWVFKTKKVLDCMRLSQEGQEPQYYFSIDLAKKEKYVPPKPKFIFDTVRQVYIRVDASI